MKYFIEGYQNVGKSTLLKSLGRGYKVKVFKFADGCKNFDILNSKDKLNGFQIGKDLGIFFAFENTKNKVLFDRGPFSTLYYSLLENRMSEKEIREFLKVLENYKEEFCYIFVNKINDQNKIIRNKNDAFDYLVNVENQNSMDAILDTLKFEFSKRKIQLYFFENDYSKSIKENVKRFKNLIKEIEVKNEHN